MKAPVAVITHKFRNLLIFQFYHGVQSRMISVVIRISDSEAIIFCVVVAICDPVHDVEAIFHLMC